MKRRIYPPKNAEGILERLTTIGPGIPVQIFSTKQKAMMYAAALGYFRNERTKLESRGEGIRYDIFEKALDDSFIDALAIAEKDDLEILSDERESERAEIFEEYAHTGLLEMEKLCFKKEGDPLENLIRLSDEVRSTESSDIEGIDSNILKGLIG